MFWGVMKANLAIGQGYTRSAQVLEQSLSGQIVFVENDVPLRIMGHVYIAAAVEWRYCDVRVTPGVVYLFQYQKFGSRRMGQPVIAILLNTHHQAAVGTDLKLVLKSPARREGADVHLACARKPFGSMTVRLRLRDPDGFLRGLAHSA
jgi:hypothetical protein